MLSNNTTANDHRSANDNNPDGLAKPVVGKTRAPNLPSKQYAGGLIAVSGFSPVKPKIHITRSQIAQAAHVTMQGESGQGESGEKLVPGGSLSEKNPRRKIKKTGRGPVYFMFLLWLFVLVAIAINVLNRSDNVYSALPLTITAASIGVFSLILSGFAKNRRAKIINSLGIATASLCFAVLLWIYLQTSGRTITPEFLVMSLSAASLVIARIWQSPYLLNLSILLGLGWCIYGFMSYQAAELAWAFPVLGAVQMYIALEFRITRTVLLSIISGFIWLGINLPLLNL